MSASSMEARQGMDLPSGTPKDIVQFMDYWSGLSREGFVPSLTDYLDNAPPRLQPFVSIADIQEYAPPKVRLLGTALADIIGRDTTGQTLNLHYAEKLLPLVAKVAWAVVSRPVGYLCVRAMRTSSGRILKSPSICLPLRNPRSAIMAGVTYMRIDFDGSAFGPRDRFEAIQDLKITHWIDLGAGVPTDI